MLWKQFPETRVQIITIDIISYAIYQFFMPKKVHILHSGNNLDVEVMYFKDGISDQL